MKSLLCLFALSLLFSLPVHAEDLASFRTEALAQINAFRQKEGLLPVRFDDSLNAISLAWARHLVEVGRMVHRDPSDLTQQMRQNHWGTINENLFYSKPPSPATQAVTAWKNSPPHRRNLLDPKIDRIGIGIAAGENGAFFAVFNGAGTQAKVGLPGFSFGF